MSLRIGHEQLELKGLRTIKARTRKVKFTWGVDTDWFYGLQFYDENNLLIAGGKYNDENENCDGAELILKPN